MSGKIYEWKDITGNRKIKTRVCIIGTGCGGATLASELTKQGIDVVMLEQGGYYPTYTFDNHELNMAGKVSAERNLQTTADGAINLLYGNNVGGASVHYWADSYRTPADRLEMWQSEYGIEHHTEKDLIPAWDELDKRLNVHPASDEYLNPMNRLVEKGAKKLGWHGHRVPQARKNCQKSGHCMQGCAFAAKQSQLVTHIDDVVKRGGTIYSDARADRLKMDGRKVRSLLARIIHRPSGKDGPYTIEIEADAFVVAAGGFGSSTFLLKNDLKKKLPVLGEFLGINPSPFVHALYAHDVIQWRNIPAGFGVDHFRKPVYDAKGNYVEGGYLLMPNQLHPGMLAAVIPGMGKEHQQWMSALPRIGGTIGWIDDVPTELGRIELSGGVRKVHYSIGRVGAMMIRDLLKKQVLINFAAGAEKVLIPDNRATLLTSPDQIDVIDGISLRPGTLLMAAPHPSGGCRMGPDAKTSVVNSEHRVHGFDNLYVADSSVFPTGVSVDPSYTIMAFSYVAARSISGAL